MKTAEKTGAYTIVCFFAVLFSHSAIARILDFENFAHQLGQAPGLHGYGETAASLIIASLVVSVILMCIPSLRVWGLWMVLGTVTVFAGYTATILINGSPLPCRCIGLFDTLSWKLNLLINSVLMNLALGCIILLKRNEDF